MLWNDRRHEGEREPDVAVKLFDLNKYKMITKNGSEQRILILTYPPFLRKNTAL